MGLLLLQFGRWWVPYVRVFVVLGFWLVRFVEEYVHFGRRWVDVLISLQHRPLAVPPLVLLVIWHKVKLERLKTAKVGRDIGYKRFGWLVCHPRILLGLVLRLGDNLHRLFDGELLGTVGASFFNFGLRLFGLNLLLNWLNWLLRRQETEELHVVGQRVVAFVNNQVFIAHELEYLVLLADESVFFFEAFFLLLPPLD